MKNSIVGVDIGGSKIRAVLWDGKKVLSAREIKTPKNLTAFRKALRKLLLHLTKGEGLGEGVIKIGIAVPGRARSAVFVSATNLPYIRNFNFAKFFTGARVRVDHDARCFARAEYKDKRKTLFLTLGTGVGRAVGKSGKILNIKKFEYPERWEKEYKRIRDSRNDTALAKFLAEKLRSQFKTYGIQRVVVGGGVSTRKNFSAGIKIKKSKFGKNAVAIGAAMLFFSPLRRGSTRQGVRMSS